MKFTASRTSFQAAVNTVKDVATDGTLPILQNVKIETVGGGLELTASNAEQTIRTSVQCQIHERGATTVQAKLLGQMVGAITFDTIDFSEDGKNPKKAVITGGDVTYKLATMDAADFPVAAKVNGDAVSFSQQELKDILRKTAYAVSTDSTRRALNGVFIQMADGFLDAVATDGRRLACVRKEKEFTGKKEVILPSSSVRILQRMLGLEGDVSVTVDDNGMKVSASNWELHTLVIADSFPNWTAVIPKDASNSATIDRQALQDAVRQVSLASATENTNVAFSFKEGALTLTASAQGLSDAKTTIPVKYSGEEVKLFLNPKYALDVLGSTDDDEVTFRFSSGAKPILVEFGESSSKAVIMPLRVN